MEIVRVPPGIMRQTTTDDLYDLYDLYDLDREVGIHHTDHLCDVCNNVTVSSLLDTTLTGNIASVCFF